MRILILDDHPGFAELLALRLQQEGHFVASFLHAPAALKAIGLHDILITDYHMPEMTGLEVAWRAYEEGWRGSLLLMSGRVEDIGASLRHPLLRGILRKPFPPESLLQALSALPEAAPRSANK